MSDTININAGGNVVFGKDGSNQYVYGDSVQVNGIRIPLQLPRRPEYFTNRKAELNALLNDIQPSRTVTLCGPGGIGKSAMATEAVWQMLNDVDNRKPPERFPDGVIWHDFYTQPKASAALEHIALSFGEEPIPSPFDAAQRALSNRTVLLILDGTEDTDDLPLIHKATGRCGVVVTSRSRRDAVERPQDIESLEPDEAVKLLKAWHGDPNADEAAFRRICELLGGLPLAVRLVGRYLMETKESPSEYLEWLEETPLNALAHGDRKLESVPILFKRSLEQVSETAKDVLSVCGLLAFSPFKRETLSVLFSNANLRSPLNELVLFGLLRRFENEFQIGHALIHTYAREHLAPDLDSDQAAANHLAGYYVKFAREQSKLGAEGFQLLDPDRPHIMAIIKKCGDQNALSLLDSIKHYCTCRGYYTDLRSAIEYCITASCRLEDQGEEANCIRALGDVHIKLDEYEEARQQYEEARPIYKQIGNRLGEANCIRAIGDVHIMFDEYKEARQQYEEARLIYKQIGNRLGEANCIQALGDVHRMLSEYENARQRYEEALPIYKQIGNRLGEANCIKALGDVHIMLSEYEETRQRYQEARLIYKQIGAQLGEVNCIWALGDVHRMLSEYENARQRYEEALPIYKQLGNRLGEANCIKALGDVHRMLSEYENARQRYEEALPIYKQIGAKYSLAATLAYLGLIYKGLKKLEEARDSLKQSIELFSKIKSPYAVTIQKWLDELD